MDDEKKQTMLRLKTRMNKPEAAWPSVPA